MGQFQNKHYRPDPGRGGYGYGTGPRMAYPRGPPPPAGTRPINDSESYNPYANMFPGLAAAGFPAAAPLPGMVPPHPQAAYGWVPQGGYGMPPEMMYPAMGMGTMDGAGGYGVVPMGVVPVPSAAEKAGPPPPHGVPQVSIIFCF